MEKLSPIKKAFSKIKQLAPSLSLDIVIPIFILLFLLELAHFFPNLQDINVWDEATYIRAGYQFLTRGVLPNLANSPLSAVLYAVTMLPVFHSPNFFVLSDAIMRILIFSLIFLSASLIARELKPYANPWVMLAILFIVPVATTMYLYPSDVLFAGFSGLAFWQMLAFYKDRNRRHLWWSSGFLGIGMLVRAEGLLLIGVLLIVTLVIVLPVKSWFRDVIAILLPFSLLVGGYVLLYGAITGDFGSGLPQRTFNNFESGHEVIYSQQGIFIPTVSARLEANEIFGTGEENNYSVLKAISRNPSVYFLRLKKTLPSFVFYAIKAYGNKFILILLWLSLRGMAALLQKKHIALVVMGILWFIPLGVGFLNTFFREGYFMMPYFVIFASASIGVSAILENFGKPSEKIGMLAAAVIIGGISILSQNTSMLYRATLFFVGLGILHILYQRITKYDQWHMHAMWGLLVITLIIRGGYSSPALPSYGTSPIERSVYFLQDTFPVQSKILAGSPANIWAARMSYSGINSYDIPDFASESAFLDWVRIQDIDAVYVDRHFPAVHQALVFSLEGIGFKEIYADASRDIVIYEVIKDGAL